MLKVMLIDDSDIARTVLRDLLAAVGDTAITGEFRRPAEAIAGIRDNPPDVILLDIQLDGGIGLEVLRVVSREQPQIKVIVVTNHTDRVFRVHYVGAGAHSFFDKSRELAPLRDCLVNLNSADVGVV